MCVCKLKGRSSWKHSEKQKKTLDVSLSLSLSLTQLAWSMELGVKSPVRSPSPSHPLSPTRLAKLPPIAPGGKDAAGEQSAPFYATPSLMESACTELRDSMGHLLDEVRHLSRLATCIYVELRDDTLPIPAGPECRDKNTEGH